MHYLLTIALMGAVTHANLGLNDGNKDDWQAYYGEKFECYKDDAGVYTTAGQYVCCGYMANGERECANQNQWTNVGGTATLKTNRFSLCENTLAAVRSANANDGTPNKDLCCANDYFSDCGVCQGFMVWEFETFEEMSGDSRVTFDENWKEAFLDQPEDITNAYSNQIYPAGFVHAKLREFNDPPVCVFIPSAGGRVIEIRVEPEESGNTVCFNDLYDDTEDRNNPGQITTCDDTRLRTCFSDGDLQKPGTDKIPGFPFFINCVEGCEDSDVNLWFRARASETTWVDVENQEADSNMEMWCNWMDRDTPEWDTYPSEIAPPGQVIADPVDNGIATFSLFLSVVLAVLLI